METFPKYIRNVKSCHEVVQWKLFLVVETFPNSGAGPIPAREARREIHLARGAGEPGAHNTARASWARQSTQLTTHACDGAEPPQGGDAVLGESSIALPGRPERRGPHCPSTLGLRCLLATGGSAYVAVHRAPECGGHPRELPTPPGPPFATPVRTGHMAAWQEGAGPGVRCKPPQRGEHPARGTSPQRGAPNASPGGSWVSEKPFASAPPSCSGRRHPHPHPHPPWDDRIRPRHSWRMRSRRRRRRRR